MTVWTACQGAGIAAVILERLRRNMTFTTFTLGGQKRERHQQHHALERVRRHMIFNTFTLEGQKRERHLWHHALERV